MHRKHTVSSNRGLEADSLLVLKLWQRLIRFVGGGGEDWTQWCKQTPASVKDLYAGKEIGGRKGHWEWVTNQWQPFWFAEVPGRWKGNQTWEHQSSPLTSDSWWWQGYRGSRTLFHCCWKCKLVQPLWKSMKFPTRKLGIDLPEGPAILLLGAPSYHE